jgi:hypothetical protein
MLGYISALGYRASTWSPGQGMLTWCHIMISYFSVRFIQEFFKVLKLSCIIKLLDVKNLLDIKYIQSFLIISIAGIKNFIFLITLVSKKMLYLFLFF